MWLLINNKKISIKSVFFSDFLNLFKRMIPKVEKKIHICKKYNLRFVQTKLSQKSRREYKVPAYSAEIINAWIYIRSKWYSEDMLIAEERIAVVSAHWFMRCQLFDEVRETLHKKFGRESPTRGYIRKMGIKFLHKGSVLYEICNGHRCQLK